MTARPKHDALPGTPALRREVLYRALGAAEARRLTNIIVDGERRAREHLRDRVAEATREAQAILAAARAEATEILARLPDFAAIEAAPGSKGGGAMRAIRRAADRYGIAMSAVTGRNRNPVATKARAEAVLGVVEACPGIDHAEVGKLFSGLSAVAVARLVRVGREERFRERQMSERRGHGRG